MVTVYSQPNCNNCTNVKRFLDMKGISYREIDIQEDPQAFSRIVEWGYKSTPVVETAEGEHWNDFRIEKMLKLCATV